MRKIIICLSAILCLSITSLYSSVSFALHDILGTFSNMTDMDLNFKVLKNKCSTSDEINFKLKASETNKTVKINYGTDDASTTKKCLFGEKSIIWKVTGTAAKGRGAHMTIKWKRSRNTDDVNAGWDNIISSGTHENMLMISNVLSQGDFFVEICDKESGCPGSGPSN